MMNRSSPLNIGDGSSFDSVVIGSPLPVLAKIRIGAP